MSEPVFSIGLFCENGNELKKYKPVVVPFQKLDYENGTLTMVFGDATWKAGLRWGTPYGIVIYINGNEHSRGKFNFTPSNVKFGNKLVVGSIVMYIHPDGYDRHKCPLGGKW